MASGFTLSMYPWVYEAKYGLDHVWSEVFVEKPHRTPVEEAAMPEAERLDLMAKRNSFPELPLINYTTQYGLGCFEGLKAFPQPDGSVKVFRPDENGARLKRSMEGLRMPGFPVDMFVHGVLETVKRNVEAGFSVAYDPRWEADSFVNANAIYIRPFSYAEPGIGLGLSGYPWVIMGMTPVGSYFDPDASTAAVTTDKLRATPGGTGWIKCNANYVMPILVKREANDQGYMEAIFLDMNQQYVEEGSSCNIFFRMKDGNLVTPELGDTILPGINRASVLALANDMGVTTEARKVSIDEVMSNCVECFVTGTAAGVSYIESITHKGATATFGDGSMGELSRELLVTLKGIQYGSRPDVHGWMFEV
ncbi:MAG: aminotransferase class IV [Spirochaetaceae bacterium]